MPEPPSADRTAESLFWYYRRPSRYQAEGRRRDAPRLDPEVVLRLALSRPVVFVDASWNEPQKVAALQEAAAAYVRHMFFRPDATPYQTLGLEPGASVQAIKESFRLLMQLVHPDRQGARKLWPDACAAQANSAYAILRNQDTRRTFEEEAEARATLARAIYRAASAAEASQMPTVTWPKRPLDGRRPLARRALPEWLTAGVGGYARQHPAATAFSVLIGVAVLIMGASLIEGRQGLLVRVAREAPTPATEVESPPTLPAAKSSSRATEPADPTPVRRSNPTGERPEIVASGAPAVADAAISPPRTTEAIPEPRERREIASASAPAISMRMPVQEPVPAPASTPVSVASVASPASPASAPALPVSAPANVPAPAPATLALPPAVAPSPPSMVVESVPVPRGSMPPAIVPTVAQTVARADPSASTPDVARSATAIDAAAALPPAGGEIEALFATFVDSYERGRIDAFAALFDADANTNLRHGRAAIRSEYDELFRLSQWRRMQLTHVNWRRVGDRAVAKGEITVRIGWRDGREVEQRLNVDMELMRRDGRVVIARLSHQPKSP